ncbi:P-loop containing nucleoside triphosphate hydrolase protein [Lentinula raphanica]|uniref:P-loop containing nucleoside triphosphate hydrolase protein n=1 Tax=Lentinula raphanica TaxID=153919 RepID=A0AA38PJH3_9AGAR|nr:P-loop containing nucleoside triphosphate hydrolase protein [Lentinula raphanica]
MPSSSSITALLPRKYQEEIFTQAQQRNIIAALDTGSGKTFISTLLVKWIAAKDLDCRKIFFFVPKVPLVEQQGNFISHHSSLRVLKLHGSSNIDVSDRSGWKQKFEQHDVFVLTAQIFLNFMTHSLLRMEEVSLLVFDECHHARKKHPYAIIMHEYTQCSQERRPKVFGMTASPIWNPKDPATSLKVLEDTLDAKVIGVREHAGELSEHSPKPIEMMKLYAPAPETYDYPSPSIWDTLKVFTFLKDVDLENGSQWQDIQRRYYVTLQNLGPYAASLYLFTEASNAIIRLFNIYSLTGEAEREEHAILRSSSPQKIPSELFDIADVLVDYQSFFTKPDDPSLLPVLVPLSWCTPKVRTLVDILRAHHSPTFQGIVFVEQRQIAACLAKILPQIPELIGLFKCGSFVGGVGGSERFTGDAGQEQVAQAFREHKLNLLVATSVAEEGLDFPACDVVIRFDSLDHVVGYVQSRGRARNKLSNFIVMIQEDDLAFQERYKKFIDTEPKLREAYQAQLGLFQDSTKAVNHDDDEEEEEGEIPADMASRERYTVPSTRAFVTYDSALSLISHLCSLIPHDLYTPQPAPVYTGEFRSTLHLPASLPLPPKDLVYLGPVKGSKKEAKRAVAFLAVKRLHQLDVFDDYLLPIGSGRGKDFQDAEGKPVPDMSHVPPTMDVQVRDPWVISHNLYVHPISLDGKVIAGLITSSRLEPVQIDHLGSIVETQCGRLLELPSNKEMEYLRLMEDYTKLGVNIRISASPFVGHTSFFLVPLMSSGDIDFYSMEELVANPNGSSDWSSIDETHLDHLLVYNVNQHGRTWLLRGLRPDLTPMSLISTDDSPQTYYDYYLKRWSPKSGKNRNGWAPVIPTTGPMVELSRLIRSKSTQILTTSIEEPNVELSEKFIIPQGCCNWLSMSVEVSRIFHILPTLARRITDIYRARAAKFRLSLPPINDDLMVSALTIPSTLAPFNNQRLETLGDAVLEVCTTVHLMNKFPHRHEGQLSIIRQQSICNRFLMYRALEVNLDAFITSEPMTVRSWKSHIEVKDHESGPLCFASRSYPRRSLQDCMEATLGAAFLTGGIPMALQAGNALGLTFGGPSHWSLRYSRVENTMIPPMYTRLQDQLGYDFNNVYLLREALTHPSFASEAEIIPSYQRLEFLGDALLDLVVIHYLYNKFPQAESAQLALPRTKAVCSQALAFLAVKKLELHQVILLNNVGLSKAIDGYVPHLQGTSAQAIVNTGWKLDPPKVLSDVFESVIGAVLIDSGYDYERTACVVEFAMQEILNLLSPSIPLDPISALVHWIAASVCRAPIEFIVVKQGECEGTQVVLHGTVIAGPVISASLLVSKNLVAERALAILQDTSHERCLSRLCVCDAEKDLGMASGTYVVELDNVDSSLEDG